MDDQFEYERTMDMKYAIVVSLAVLVLAGCGGAPRNNASSPPDGNQTPGVRVQQTAPDRPEIVDKTAVAAHLEALAGAVPQVKGATCVVVGNTAIVGIDVEPDLKRERVDVVKYSVSEALRKDPYGKYAIVTADMDLGERIRDISTAVREGRPISGFAEEMVDLVGRIVPQIPLNLTPSGTGTPGPTGNEQAPVEQKPLEEAPQGTGTNPIPGTNQSPGRQS